MKKAVHILVSFIVLIAIWQLAVTLGSWNQTLFPSPLSVVKSFQELILTGTLAAGIKDSLYRFTVGYFMSAISGIVVGLI